MTIQQPMLQVEREILAVLAEGGDGGGFITRDIARSIRPFGANRQQHSGAVRSWLTQLFRRGFVGHLDQQKPVCWTVTPAGRAALQNATDGGADG